MQVWKPEDQVLPTMTLVNAETNLPLSHDPFKQLPSFQIYTILKFFLNVFYNWLRYLDLISDFAR